MSCTKFRCCIACSKNARVWTYCKPPRYAGRQADQHVGREPQKRVRCAHRGWSARARGMQMQMRRTAGQCRSYLSSFPPAMARTRCRMTTRRRRRCTALPLCECLYVDELAWGAARVDVDVSRVVVEVVVQPTSVRVSTCWCEEDVRACEPDTPDTPPTV
jgi:hypothetical protein